MEHQIKTLYIITMLAILVFLGMQLYWLYGRYEYALNEYESDLSERIINCVDQYNAIREKKEERAFNTTVVNEKQDTITIPTFSLQQEYGDSVKTTRKSKISTYVFSAYELLGIPEGTPLTYEQKMQAADLAQSRMDDPIDSIVFDSSGAKDENEAWIATKNVMTERRSPFTVKGIDSVLNKEKIKARIILEKVNRNEWKIRTDHNISLWSPCVSVSIPYSQLQGKIVNISSYINPLEILPGMWQILMVAVATSALLILCLIFQFSTVLKLSRLDKMRNSFITTMIHELKRPISTLKMCLSGLDNDRMMADREFKNEIIMESKTAIDNLSAYFSKLRDITFNNVEQIPLNIQVVNLHGLFDKVIKAAVIPSGKMVDFRNEIDKNLEISADQSHLFNIFSNLVENAIKYSGETVEIKFVATKSDEEVEISVLDTGIGIPSNEMKHIFKRFYRGKNFSGEQPGIGLGLAYVKLLIEAHGGEVKVESEEGKGTCFKINLPQ